MVMPMYSKVEKSNIQLSRPLHSEDGDGGWDIWQEIETRLYTALRGRVLKLSRWIQELATRD